MIQHVLFDNDGTLVDTEAIAQKIMLMRLLEMGIHIEEEEYAATYPGLRDEEIMALLKSKYNLTIPANFVAEIYADCQRLFAEELLPVAGIPELLMALRLPFSVVSNGTSFHVNRCMEQSGLKPLITGQIFGVEMVAHPKPAPDLYLLALRTHQLQPEQAVVVEDTRVGIMAAKAAGITAIGFLGARHVSSIQAELLLAAGADYVMHDGAELLALFAALGLTK